MRIGELSRQTGVPVRLLRYYEDQGLLRPDRSANGYRAYEPADVQRVTQIRGLIDAGVPTAIIRDILPCLDDPCTIVPQRSRAWRHRRSRTAPPDDRRAHPVPQQEQGRDQPLPAGHRRPAVTGPL